MIAAFNPGLLILPLVPIVLVLIFWAARKQTRKTRAGLAAFATRAGLRMNEKTALGFTTVESLEGEQQGRPVRYWGFTTGSGKSRTSWVAVGVRVPAGITLQFGFTRQNFSTKLMELFGAREIQVGDRAFDEAWFVRTNQPEFLAAALVPAIRAKLMAEIPGRWFGSYKLDQGFVQYVEQGWLSPATVERFEQKLPLLQDLADVAEVSARA